MPLVDYTNSIVNVANSILKDFGAPTHHASLACLNEFLQNGTYRNVVLVVLDGMGINVLEEHLDQSSFLRGFCVGELSSVVPSATAAAIPCIRSGLTPAETGHFGWSLWFEELNRTVALFNGEDMQTEECLPHGYNPANALLPYPSITDAIRKTGAKAHVLHHVLHNFGKRKYNIGRSMTRRLRSRSRNFGKRSFTYCYCNQPDYTLHRTGTRGEDVATVLRKIDKALARFAKKMRRTALIVIADHGHLNLQKRYFLEECPALTNTLRAFPDIEQRLLGCRVKQGREADFLRACADFFGDDVDVLPKQRTIELGLFGNTDTQKTGQDYPQFERLPDFFLAGKPGITVDYHGGASKNQLVSTHGGITPQEMLVPLIVCVKD
ncbi:MAG: alkaline phosphatase family protein [Oscillospiraceae bacterium]|jgi:hypothetical protein|nr:alkaline phosphatase family protein [Oscillospiraceae bacterium]